MSYLRPWFVLVALAAAGCVAIPHGPAAPPAQAAYAAPVVVYVVKRRWHTDIGFRATDLPAAFDFARARLPAARYLLFGFGDRSYLLHGHRSFGGLLTAVWPGPGVLLLTGLTNTPQQAFGKDAVIRLTLDAGQAHALEDFIGKSLSTDDGARDSLGPGPYADSAYYASTLQYSGLDTCNTWTTHAMQAAGLPISSFGVVFSGQVWRRLGNMERRQSAALAPGDAR